jgi:heterotetrameric sarcosine oxidase delta subunit
MRIPCPYCGERDAHEFTYLGDAGLRARPAPDASAEAWHAYVYLRANPAGPQRELWYHGSGCRSWLEVTRDTVSHAVLAVIQASAEEQP